MLLTKYIADRDFFERYKIKAKYPYWFLKYKYFRFYITITDVGLLSSSLLVEVQFDESCNLEEDCVTGLSCDAKLKICRKLSDNQ